MSYGISSRQNLDMAYMQAEKFGRAFHEKMDEIQKSTEMLEALADAQKALSDWRANGSNVDSDGDGKTVQQEAIEKLEQLIAKYPEFKDDFGQGLAYAKKYKQGAAEDECNQQIDAMMKTVDNLKDVNGKHEQLLTLEMNDLHQSYNRVALQASEQLGANNQVMQSIIGNIRG